MSYRRLILTARQWAGAFCLLAAVAAIVLFIYLIPQPSLSPVISSDTLAQILPPDTARRAYPHYRRNKSRTPYSPSPFDPNTADSLTLIRQGLKPWQTHNLIKYRRAGGRFRQAEDMRRLYGLTEAQYQSIRPYIRIGKRPVPADTIVRDTFPKYISHKRDTVLELNTADTTQLQMLRGIGRWTAVQIVRYRERLGGYYSAQQLREIPHIDQQMLDTVISRLTVDTAYIQTLDINRLNAGQLTRHPYLRFEQAKQIYELRRRSISIGSLDELRQLPSLTEPELDKLRHYLSVE